MDYARVLRLPQYFRNLQRLTEIVRVLIRHGFGDLLDRLQIRRYLETSLKFFNPRAGASASAGLDLGTRCRLACEELGPTFIKFAQLVATRPDIFPFSVVREFRRLQDRVPSFPVSQARQVIESEFGRPISELCREFDDEPLAAASIAQVHRAVLRDGAVVIMKVQRPSIERTIDTDIDILRGLAALLEEHLPETRSFKPIEIIEEFARGLRRECDFRREASNLRKFARNFSQEEGLVVPRIVEHLCGRRVLTEEFIEGVKADDLDALKTLGVDGPKVAKTLTRVVLKSLFEHSFFHADPHPGNVLITKQGKVALIDFGAMGRLDRTRLHFILHFLVAVFSKDLDRMVRVLVDAQMVSKAFDEVALKNQVAEIIDHHLSQTLGTLDVSHLLYDVFEVVQRYGVRPPVDVLLVGKSLATLEHIGAGLDPSFDPMRIIQPYLSRRYLRMLSDPKLYKSYALETAESYRQLLAELPRQLRWILSSLVKGEVSIFVRRPETLEIIKHQNALVNRSLQAFVAVACLSLSVFLLTDPHGRFDFTMGYTLLVSAIILFALLWLAIRRTGGSS